jgi:hypothetical protein
MFDRKLIDEKELLRISYKMFAEVWDQKAPKGLRKPITKPAAASTGPASDPGTDPTDPQAEPQDK